MMGVGYDDEGQFFWVRNSWGDSWGIGGYCQIPYSYLTNPQLAADFWTIRTVD
jgi:C1A family cysteine protease